MTSQRLETGAVDRAMLSDEPLRSGRSRSIGVDDMADVEAVRCAGKGPFTDDLGLPWTGSRFLMLKLYGSVRCGATRWSTVINASLQTLRCTTLYKTVDLSSAITHESRVILSYNPYFGTDVMFALINEATSRYGVGISHTMVVVRFIKTVMIVASSAELQARYFCTCDIFQIKSRTHCIA